MFGKPKVILLVFCQGVWSKNTTYCSPLRVKVKEYTFFRLSPWVCRSPYLALGDVSVLLCILVLGFGIKIDIFTNFCGLLKDSVTRFLKIESGDQPTITVILSFIEQKWATILLWGILGPFKESYTRSDRQACWSASSLFEFRHVVLWEEVLQCYHGVNKLSCPFFMGDIFPLNIVSCVYFVL